MEYTLTLLTGSQERLLAHLFNGDGKESAAIGLCSVSASRNPYRLLLKEVVTVPIDVCSVRTDGSIAWPFEWLDPLLARAETENLSIVKFHSHPTEWPFFSEADDVSDAALFDGIHGYLDDDKVHGSVVVMPSGRMLGRVALPSGEFVPMDKIAILGRQPIFWLNERPELEAAGTSVGRHSRGFGREMRQGVSRLAIAIVGISGTGSIVVEQIARLNFGRLVLIDPENVEPRNLDRILNADKAAADAREPKVLLAKRHIEALGFGTDVVALPVNIASREAIEAIASCDIIFGCVDGAEGRAILDRIVASQLQMLIDVGVGAEADEDGAIDQIDAAIHTVLPAGSSLLSRGVYTPTQVHAEMMRRLSPAMYEQLRKEKYIKGVDEDQPAVISINMVAASNAVMELIARLYPFRHQADLSQFDAVRINLAEVEYTTEQLLAPCPAMLKLLARGNAEPLLNLPQLSNGAQ
ncbi:MAG: protein similar to deubiquitination enzyme [Bradyrhizobium sp.]|nr:protein similar to deubiquitination enzyme [Bradyrhizobium sp.]